jgi:hypothetical protein
MKSIKHIMPRESVNYKLDVVYAVEQQIIADILLKVKRLVLDNVGFAAYDQCRNHAKEGKIK